MEPACDDPTIGPSEPVVQVAPKSEDAAKSALKNLLLSYPATTHEPELLQSTSAKLPKPVGARTRVHEAPSSELVRTTGGAMGASSPPFRGSRVSPTATQRVPLQLTEVSCDEVESLVSSGGIDATCQLAPPSGEYIAKGG
jgi:hypothetical protein